MLRGMLDEAIDQYKKSVAINPNLGQVRANLGFAYLKKGMLNEARSELIRAIELNPNGAEAHVNMGQVLFYSGRSDDAIRFLRRGFRLNPIPSSYHYSTLGQAYRANGQYQESIAVAKKSLQMNPDQLTPCVTLAASYSALNRSEEAGRAAGEVLRIHPTFSLEYFGGTIPYKYEKDRDIFINALRKAGLPD